MARRADHIFGVVLLNDWSARDIQAWEYVPLGPFLGKSFATRISAWVVPFEALAGAGVPVPGQDPAVLPYLDGAADERSASTSTSRSLVNGQVVGSPEYSDMYWSPAQMLAHMTVNGARLRIGDLFASGTVSGADGRPFGSLLELTWNGTDRSRSPTASTRAFLEDGDTVTLRGWSPGAAGRVTLGEVNGRVVANEA